MLHETKITAKNQNSTQDTNLKGVRFLPHSTYNKYICMPDEAKLWLSGPKVTTTPIKKKNQEEKSTMENSNTIHSVLNLCAIIDKNNLKCFNKFICIFEWYILNSSTLIHTLNVLHNMKLWNKLMKRKRSYSLYNAEDYNTII